MPAERYLLYMSNNRT